MSSDDVPPGARCSNPECSREALDPDHPAGFCAEHRPGADDDPSDEFNQHDTPNDGSVLVNDDGDAETADTAVEEGGSPVETPTPDVEKPASSGGVWADIEFTPGATAFPTPHTDRDQWMARKAGDKAPWAPWADDDAPVECSHEEHDDATTCDECGHSAAFKWGSEGSAEYVHADFETAREWADMHPQANGELTFIQRDDSPLAFVDGDDVRCPETGDVHPAFTALLEHLGLTFADISTSGSGAHAYYVGDLPLDGKDQATFDIDTEPWGSNDSPPTVEIYTNKHVCVVTGDHVPGTPNDAREWDETALRAILEANGFTDQPDITHDTDRDRPELEDYDPETTSADEKATDVRDILAAIDGLEPRDLPLRSRQTGTDGTGWETWDPSYRTSESGASVHRPPSEAVFYDHKKGESFGLLGLFAAEQGIITDPWSRLGGEDWWQAVDEARETGAPIPEFDTADDAEHTAILPDTPALDTATSGWDWRHSSTEHEAALTIDEARERTVDVIADAYTSGDRRLVEALPTMGKSYGAIKAAADTGEPITVLTGRGRKEQYGQFKDWCEEHGLEYKELPSFTHDCPTAAGEHGDEWRETVMDWYRRGATPQEIHNAAEYHLDQPLPCQLAEDGTHIDCAYRHVWNFDPEEYDVLIGHYVHAHTQQVAEGRTVVFDEFPDAYETHLDVGLQGAVSYWLSTVDVPFESYTDLVENRDDQQRRAEALLWFEEHDLEPDERHVFDDGAAHADTPLAVFTILAGEDLGNGFEHADLDDHGTGVFNRETGAVSLLQPPEFGYENSIVALDGTPTKRMWELTLGTRLNHRPVLQDEERADYIRDALNLNLVRTTDAVKPYNSPDHVTTDQDAALLEGVAEAHDERPSVISSRTALEEYDSDGVLQLVDETKHYGNVLGSNEFKSTRLGAVIGSNHYGDHYIQKWGAYAGRAVERNDEKGTGLSYGDFGDRVLQHMREHDTLQAAMRFGRDGNGAVVYVHTDTLPEWVPVAGDGRVVSTWSDGMRDVLAALEDLGGGTTAEIVAHPAIDVGRRQVFDHLETLRERGVLSREQDPDDGRRIVWQDGGLHRVNEHGEVDFDEVSLDELSNEEVQELARSSNYTWEFRNLAGGTETDATPAGGGRPLETSAGVNGRGGPPDGAD